MSDGSRSAGIGSRRAARERALELLYEAEVKQQEPGELIGQLPVAPDEFTTELVTGVGEHLAELDELIGSYARGWAVERMPALDRALLRIGAFELLHRQEIPTAVSISEAVELAKRFSTEESGRFVNGVLAAIAADVRSA